MFEPLSRTFTHKRTRRRLITASIVGTAVLVSAFAAPPVVNALRYDALVAEHHSIHGKLETARDSVTKAQTAFEKASGEAMTARTDIAEFIATVNPQLLADTDALDDLTAVLAALDERSGIREASWRPGVKAVPQPALAPRTPETTSPTTVDGLSFAISRSTVVLDDFSSAAERMRGRIADVREEKARAGALMEKVLASAAKYGTSSAVLKYDKATVAVRIHLNRMVGELTDASRDPLSRLIAFQKAVHDLRISHADGVAEEERLAREKKEAEKRAAEEARIAEEEARIAEEEAKAAEEARRAAEEAAREEAQGGEPGGAKPVTPTPTPTPAPTPAPTTPTPTPTPKA